MGFQVEAMIGYTHRVVEGGTAPWYFFGEKSGWNNTQTLTITETALKPSPTPIISENPTTTPDPSDPQSAAQLRLG